MADRARGGLPYGHFGTAVYNPEEQEWSFERSLDRSRVLLPIGEAQTVLPASSGRQNVHGDHSHCRLPKVASVRHPKQIKRVTQTDPSLQPAAGLLRPLLRTSEAVEAAAARHDPAQGNLLCFGRIPDESLRRPARIAVLASGPTGSDVRFVQMQLQKQGWDDSKDVWLEVPVFAGEEATWQGNGSPVQQICLSSSPEDGGALVAVRLITRTVIFRPLLQRLGPNRLDPNLLSEAHISRGGVPHAHVAFNPWFTRQFAIIDQRGGWSVYEFATKAAVHAARIHFHARSETSSGEPSDGWARILWAFNPNTMIVADRRRVALFDISSGPTILQDINLGLGDTIGWVLDLINVPSRSDLVFILTTTHILLMGVTENHRKDVEASVALRIQHFRSPEDISLRLNAFADGTDTVLLLQSSLSPVNVAYRFALDAQSTVLCDISELQMPLGLVTGVGWLHFNALEIAERPGHHISQTFAGRLQNIDARLLALLAMSIDGTVQQTFYLSHHQLKAPEAMRLPSWRGKTSTRTSTLRDRFVVEDESDDGASLSAGAVLEQRESRNNRRAHRTIATSAKERTIDLSISAEGIETDGIGTSSASNVLEQVHGLVEANDIDSHRPLQTLGEVTDVEITVDDIDRISSQIEELGVLEPTKTDDDPDADDNGPSSSLTVRRIGIPSLLRATHDRPAELGFCYDNIVSLWISPLSNRVPGAVRLAKEQLARRMAIELTLASHTLRLSIPEEPLQPAQPTQLEEQSQSQDQSWKLAVRGPPHSQLSQSGFLPAQSQQSVLPTPSPTGTPSVTTRFSQASSFAEAEVARLSKYTTFSKAAPISTPRNISNILAHWNTGEDPEVYDWLSTSRRITQQTEAEEADSQLTEKQRARLHRKADRHIRRQRREAAASQQQHIASSQMPELLVSASQPAERYRSVLQQESQPVNAGFASQGVVASSQSIMPGPASQAVPGRYGGRMPVRKKRKQGF